MRRQVYEYQGNYGTQLSFGFLEGPQLEERKRAFVALLITAADELQAELDARPGAVVPMPKKNGGDH